MSTYDFTLTLNRAPTEDEIEALFEAGCGDGTVGGGPDGGTVDFHREAPTLARAIISAVTDVEKVGGLQVTGVARDDAVTTLDIANRLEVTRTYARMLITGVRGPGGFPPPTLVTTGGEKVWDWPAVAAWVSERLGRDAPSTPHELVTADRLLAARAALREEAEADRGELAELLQAS